MAEQVLGLLLRAITYVSSWFIDIFVYTGTTGIYLSAMFIVLTFGYFLSPILRSAGSDVSVRKSSDDVDVGKTSTVKSSRKIKGYSSPVKSKTYKSVQKK